jgi:hypothetical protein
MIMVGRWVYNSRIEEILEKWKMEFLSPTFLPLTRSIQRLHRRDNWRDTTEGDPLKNYRNYNIGLIKIKS